MCPQVREPQEWQQSWKEVEPCQGAIWATPKCLFGVGVILGWLFLRTGRLRKSYFLPFPWLLKEFKQRASSQKRAITNDTYKEYGPGEMGTLAGLGDQGSPVSIVPAGPANPYLPDICFSISMRITFFCFETPSTSPTSSFVFSWR